MLNKEKIIVIDFGSQVTKLIARRIRDLGVFSEIITLSDLKKIKDFNNIKGIISSNRNSQITDIDGNIINVEMFEYTRPYARLSG